MMHRAWSSKVEVPYYFSRSYIKFQGHTALNIVEFHPNWAFPDSNSSLNSPMAMKCCTKLETAKERCPIVFQGHPSNFKVTRDKTSPILTQIGCFRTIGRSQLSNPSDLLCYSTVYSGGDQRKHQSSASLAFVRGIHRGLVNSPHKWPVTRKMFPFDDFIMIRCYNNAVQYNLILYTVLLCLRQNQGSICVCAQPMRDNVTLQHHLSLAGCIHKIIPENINFDLNSLKHAILHLYRELWGVFMMILEKIHQEITRLYCLE